MKKLCRNLFPQFVSLINVLQEKVFPSCELVLANISIASEKKDAKASNECAGNFN